jgi:hypothetical protein
MNACIYFTHPIHTGLQKKQQKILPLGLKEIGAVIKSIASRWSKEEHIIFTMNCSCNMILEHNKKKRHCIILKAYSRHKNDLNN